MLAVDLIDLDEAQVNRSFVNLPQQSSRVIGGELAVGSKRVRLDNDVVRLLQGKDVAVARKLDLVVLIQHLRLKE